MDTYSQIVSNFKVFSKTRNVEIPNSKPNIEGVNYSWIVVLVFLVGVVYYKRTELMELFNNTIYKFLLQAHITSSGEFASTYVPENTLSSGLPSVDAPRFAYGISILP